MQKQHPVFDDPQMKSYLESLPLIVQEAVFQSGVKIHTLQELQAFAAKYTAK